MFWIRRIVVLCWLFINAGLTTSTHKMVYTEYGARDTLLDRTDRNRQATRICEFPSVCKRKPVMSSPVEARFPNNKTIPVITEQDGRKIVERK